MWYYWLYIIFPSVLYLDFRLVFGKCIIKSSFKHFKDKHSIIMFLLTLYIVFIMAWFLVVFSFYLFKLDKKKPHYLVEFNEIINILIFIVHINLTSAPFQSFSGVFANL